jgi:hypothetical protein
MRGTNSPYATCGSPANDPTMTHTANLAYVNARTAFDLCGEHRRLFSVLESSRRFSGSLLQSGMPQINLASFVPGTNCAPIQVPAALPNTVTILRRDPRRRLFHPRGWPAQPVMVFLFVQTPPCPRIAVLPICSPRPSLRPADRRLAPAPRHATISLYGHHRRPASSPSARHHATGGVLIRIKHE